MKFYSGEKDTMECLNDNVNRLLVMELVRLIAVLSLAYECNCSDMYVDFCPC